VSRGKQKNGSSQYTKLERYFTALPHETTLSEELNLLTPHARWLYVVMLTKFNRDKDKINKDYEFTFKNLRKITRYDNRRLTDCINQLDKAGFILVDRGGRHIPAKYRPILSWLT